MSKSRYEVNTETTLADLRDLSSEVTTVRFPKGYKPTIDQIYALPKTVTTIEAEKHSSAFLLGNPLLIVKVFNSDTQTYEVASSAGLKRGAETQLEEQSAAKRPRLEEPFPAPLSDQSAQSSSDVPFDIFDWVDSSAKQRITDLEKKVADLIKEQNLLMDSYGKFRTEAAARINMLTQQVKTLQSTAFFSPLQITIPSVPPVPSQQVQTLHPAAFYQPQPTQASRVSFGPPFTFVKR